MCSARADAVRFPEAAARARGLYLSPSVARGPCSARCLASACPLSAWAQLGSSRRSCASLWDVAAAAADGQRAIQRQGTGSERPPRDAFTQLGPPAPVGRSGAGPRWNRKRTWDPEGYWRHSAANYDYHRPKFGRGTSKVSDGFVVFFSDILMLKTIFCFDSSARGKVSQTSPYCLDFTLTT